MFRCGYRTGVELDRSRVNWTCDGPRPLAWSAWYPAVEPVAASSAPSPDDQLFDLGEIHFAAEPAPGTRFPVVLLSRGTGGTAESLGWLARPLACQGHVVIGVAHHGNNSFEPYRPEGFLCWWERTADLSVLLSILSEGGLFADRLDLGRVSAVGFSLGGYTVLALAGAITSLAEFENWRISRNISIGGPREFPGAADHIPRLLASSEPFRRAWHRHGESFADGRVRCVVAMAPAPPVRGFEPGSVAGIEIPVTIMTGEGDVEAPSEECARWLLETNSRFRHFSLGDKVGHYTFLGMPSPSAALTGADIFVDDASVDRRQVHKQATELVLGALA